MMVRQYEHYELIDECHYLSSPEVPFRNKLKNQVELLHQQF